MKLPRACLLVFLLTLAIAGPCRGHDLGAMKLRIIETTPGRYVLDAELPPPLSGTPRTIGVPERFMYEEPPTLVSDRGVKIIRTVIRCEAQPLNATDELHLPWPRDGALVEVTWADGTTTSRYVAGGRSGITLPMSTLTSARPALADAASQYTMLGIGHILLGVDHLLFVLGLLLIVRRPLVLVETVTAFTIAHSITLAGATLGIVSVPGRVVDAMVALSIVFVGAEILRARGGHEGLTFRAPWLVAFAFGLLHGFGFANALSELGLPRAEVPLALFLFNVGVEIGQLVFVVAFLTLRWSFRRLEVRWWRWTEPLPAYAIGTVAMFWFLGRLTLLFG